MNVLLLALLILLLIALAVWHLQIRTPRRIAWRADTLDLAGAPARVERADDLVLQHDDGAHVWATRGYAIYRSTDGAPFRRVGIMRPPAGEAWGGYLRALRRMFGYQELVELMPLDEERLLVFCGGWVHVAELRPTGRRSDHVRLGRARRVLALRYFGRGKGRGLMAFGLTRDLHGAIYFAEYVTESGERPTGIWKSSDAGETWHIVYEFPTGMVRHVHVIQCDPYDGALWTGTGDRDEHCYVGRSTDGGATFTWAGHGKQIHRTCSFAFFEQSVAWPMDADFEQNHVIRWHRTTGDVTIDGELPDATYCTTRIDSGRAIAGVAQGVTEAWMFRADGSATRLAAFPSDPTPPRRGPSPGLRLARGSAEAGTHVHLNPLRTLQHEAAIFRIDRADLPA